ncbi:hypothetical protein KC318_g3048 [Hortaea werneckii]|nr:hypothetical protein KC334_g9582 [Hortaea werneckii]KAI7021977.1 hypothetical protein KC355_g2208 [Hortaea werneckii]KAI7672143.1 hypothetical protein KC318_g3048 [Hortaea werneckii]
MSGYIKGETRHPLPAARILNSDTHNYRYRIGVFEAGMDHVGLDAHSQRHPVLGGEREGPIQQGHNHAGGNNNNGFQPVPGGNNASPFVRGRGHDPYGLFAAEAESKRRRAAKKAKGLARRGVGRLRRWEEWRRGVWEPLVPPA